MAFDFAGSINLVWTLVLIVLTLPCSLVSILFAWGLIHGAGILQPYVRNPGNIKRALGQCNCHLVSKEQNG
jgi:hypothetical protein